MMSHFATRKAAMLVWPRVSGGEQRRKQRSRGCRGKGWRASSNDFDLNGVCGVIFFSVWGEGKREGRCPHWRIEQVQPRRSACIYGKFGGMSMILLLY